MEGYAVKVGDDLVDRGVGGAVEALREDGFEEEVVVFEEQLQQRGDGISTTSMGAVGRSGVPWL